jgi:hypothetical protein
MVTTLMTTKIFVVLVVVVVKIRGQLNKKSKRTALLFSVLNLVLNEGEYSTLEYLARYLRYGRTRVLVPLEVLDYTRI